MLFERPRGLALAVRDVDPPLFGRIIDAITENDPELADALAAAGYRPDVVVVSPGDALGIQLLQMTGGDSYAFSQDAPTLVVTPSVADGEGFVADASAAGTLYSSSARFETFVEDPRKNTYLARYESNAEFQVHRPDAICRLAGGS